MTAPASVHTEEPPQALGAPAEHDHEPERDQREQDERCRRPHAPAIGTRCVTAELFRALAAPPVRGELRAPRIAARAEREVLDALGPRLDRAHRVRAETDRVQLAELDELVLDLDPRRPAQDDV